MGFLDDLESRPPRDEEDPAGEGQLAFEQGRADHLVGRVVPADVLPDRSRDSVAGK